MLLILEAILMKYSLNGMMEQHIIQKKNRLD